MQSAKLWGILTAALAVGVAIGFAVAFVFAAWPWLLANPEQPRSSFTANLSSNLNVASRQFEARLKRRFPPGTSMSNLTEELQSQGFSPTWSGDSGGYRAVRYEGAGSACSHDASVYWRANEGGALVTITGSYGLTCM